MDIVLKINGRVRDPWDNDKVKPMVVALFPSRPDLEEPLEWIVGFNWLELGYPRFASTWRLNISILPDGSYAGEVATDHLDARPEENAHFHESCCRIFEKVFAPLSDSIEVMDDSGFWEHRDSAKLLEEFTDIHREAEEEAFEDDNFMM